MAPRVHGHCRADIDCDQKIQAKRSGVDVAQRGRTPSSFRDKAGNFSKRGPYSGQCGLSNEGNTCFINSALQCLAHTRGLVAYLTSCGYKRDMCVSNPLGSGGELLRVFAPLIQGIWAGQNSRMSTFHLKQAVSSHAPRFSGYRQHDAQEFLAYMLDALHEDLKRPGSANAAAGTQKPDQEAASSCPKRTPESVSQMAARAWRNHRRANDSRIVSLFHGLSRSTLRCVACGHASVTHDPLVYLSVPIPRPKERVYVLFVPLEGEPRLFAFSMRLGNPLRSVTPIVSRMTKVPVDRLGLYDTYKNQFTELKALDQSLSEKLTPRTGSPKEKVHLTTYELPTAAQCAVLMLSWHRPKCELARWTRNLALPRLVPLRQGETVESLLRSERLRNTFRYQLRNAPLMRRNVAVERNFKVLMVEGGLSDGIGHIYGRSTVWDRLVEPDPSARVAPDDSTKVTPIVVSVLNCDMGIARQGFNKAGTDLHSPENAADTATRAPVMLSDCFAEYVRTERLAGHNVWRCPRCETQREAHKRLNLARAPEVLIVHLKRFRFTGAAVSGKVTLPVRYPLRGLDLRPYMAKDASESGEPLPVYDLFAVSNHYGSLNFGHYTAYARVDGAWYNFNDETVRCIDEVDVERNRKAYILFYQRRRSRRPPPPGSR